MLKNVQLNVTESLGTPAKQRSESLRKLVSSVQKMLKAATWTSVQRGQTKLYEAERIL